MIYFKKINVMFLFIILTLLITSCAYDEITKQDRKNNDKAEVMSNIDKHSRDKTNESTQENIFIYINQRKYYLENKFSYDDLNVLNKEQLALLRNGIMAQYGYSFKTSKYQEFFSQYDWYQPTTIDVNKLLSQTDLKNIELIQTFEEYYENRLEKPKCNLKIKTEERDYSNYYSLTDTPKTFYFKFSKPMQKKNIEETLSKAISNKAKYEFEWKSYTELLLHMRDLDHTTYNFELYEEKDIFDVDIEDFSYQFQVDPQIEIVSVDLNTLEERVTRINYPRDIRWISATICQKAKFLVFWKELWMNAISSLYEYEIYTLGTNDIEQVTGKVFFEDKIYNSVGDYVSDLQQYDDEKTLGGLFSPNNQNLVILTGRYDDEGWYDNETHAILFDSKGKVLKRIPLEIEHEYLVGSGDYPVFPKFTWLDNNKIILEGLKQKVVPENNLYNLYKININTETVELFISNAFCPILLGDNSVFAIDNYGNMKIYNDKGLLLRDLNININPNDKTQPITAYEASKIKVFHCNGKLIYLSNNKINVYDLSTGITKEMDVSDNSEIIGVIGDKLYVKK